MNEAYIHNEPNRYDKGRRRRLRLLTFVLLSFMCWTAITFWNQQGGLSAKYARLSSMESQLEEAKKINEQLKMEITRLNDNEYIEQRVRKDYRMTRPGETLFITPMSGE